MQSCLRHPLTDRGTGLLGNLELHRTLCFLPDDHRTLCNPITVGDIADEQLDQIARAEFAIDCKIEMRQVTSCPMQLETNANCRDIAKTKGCFLTDQLALVPRRDKLAEARDA